MMEAAELRKKPHHVREAAELLEEREMRRYSHGDGSCLCDCRLSSEVRACDTFCSSLVGTDRSDVAEALSRKCF